MTKGFPILDAIKLPGITVVVHVSNSGFLCLLVCRIKIASRTTYKQQTCEPSDSDSMNTPNNSTEAFWHDVTAGERSPSVMDFHLLR